MLCLGRVFLGNGTLLREYAAVMIEPLLEIYKTHDDFKLREMAVSILGDICATPGTSYCMRIL